MLIVVIALLGAVLLFGPPQEVSTRTLLADWGEPMRFLKPDSAGYRTVEASSFDRKSRTPGNEDWFANGDFGQYLRTENTQGREEFVMADFRGPGAVVRIWSANPAGIVRFYFDGEASPRLERSFRSILFAEDQDFPRPISQPALQGGNLFFPFPFAKSLKVTISRSEPADPLDRMYYQIQARLYGSSTRVESWGPAASSRTERARAALRLTSNTSIGAARSLSGAARPGRPFKAAFSAPQGQPQAVSELRLVVAPAGPVPSGFGKKDWEKVLSRMAVVVATDGQRTLSLPLAGFFGAGVLPAEMETKAASTKTIGEFTEQLEFRLPIPFARRLEITVSNATPGPEVKITGQARVAPVPGSLPIMALHGVWTTDFERTRPFRDFTVGRFTGQGRWVGTVLHMQNKSKKWWGEGDEKVWVDGEAFPSWFGTGTEDYIGYAWSSFHTFSTPFMGQPRSDGPASAGQIGNVRWHLVDDIPFERSIQFDIEIWHWDDADCRFAASGFWYARPSGWQAPPVDPAKAELIDASPVPLPRLLGAIEGEELKVSERTGGSLTIQDYFTHLSNGAQVWWADAPVGSKISFAVKAPEAGRYKLSGVFCHAPDYGRHQISLNGKPIQERDFYSSELLWKRVDLGEHVLPAGDSVLTFEVLTPNPAAEPKNMLGIDCLFLQRIIG